MSHYTTLQLIACYDGEPAPAEAPAKEQKQAESEAPAPAEAESGTALVKPPRAAVADPDLPEGTEMVMPGDSIEMTVELGKPIAMDEGLRFAIREGGRTVGAGRVVKITK